MLFTGSKSAIPDRLLAGDDLPEGWEWTSLQSLVNWRKGKKPDGLHETPWPGAIPYIDIQAFENGNIRRYTDPSSSVLVDPNDVIVVWDGARCGYVGKSSTKGALGSTLAMLKPVLVESDYLLQFLQSRYETINSNPRGTGIPHVEPELFWNLKVPLAPLVEQKRIVAKVEQLLARVNAARERLAKVPAILKRFRQSVLAAACSGRLTADWRDNTKIRLTGPQILDSIAPDRKSAEERNAQNPSWSFFDHPETWDWTFLSEIAESKLGKMLDKKKNVGVPTKYLRNINVRWFGFDLNGLQEMKATKEDRKKLCLCDEDVLVCEGGEPGRAAVWENNTQGLIYQKALHRIRLKGNIQPKWLVYNLWVDADNKLLDLLYT
jgi:type I restriction enzyme S subunit